MAGFYLISAFIAAIVFVLVISQPFGRLCFIVLGGLLTFQSSSTALKIGYSAGAIACVALAAASVTHRRRRDDSATFAWITGAGAVLVILMGATLFVSLRNAVPVLAWFRDVLPYLLLGALPVVGLDAGVHARAVHLRILLVAAPLISAVAFLTDWLTRRGVSALPIGRFAFGSPSLAVFGLGIALAGLAAGRGRKPLWGAMAVFIPMCLLLTGSRSAIVSFAAGFLGVMGARRKLRLPPLATALAVVASGFILLILIPLIGSYLTTESNFYEGRFGGIAAIIGQGDVAQDQSFQGRSAQTTLVLDVFHRSPIFGNGPGFSYASSVQALDTPFAPLARVGGVGTLVLLSFAVAWVVCYFEIRRNNGYGEALTVWRVFGFGFVGSLPFGSAFDDKGLALAVVLLLTAAASGVSVSASRMHDGVQNKPGEREPLRQPPVRTNLKSNVRSGSRSTPVLRPTWLP